MERFFARLVSDARVAKNALSPDLKRASERFAVSSQGKPVAKRQTLFGSWYQLTMLTIESQAVIGLRLLRLGKGGTIAANEARRMITEKAMAGSVAAATILTGGGVDKAIKRTRTRVRQNARRLMR